MNKTELENAIKNKERLWVVQDGKMFNTVLKADIMENGWGDYWKNFVYKNKSEAEHYLHHANIYRIEQLPFLTYDEFLKKEGFEFYNRHHEKVFVYYDRNLIFIESNSFTEFCEKLNKRNFYLAYDYCVKLFKGE